MKIVDRKAFLALPADTLYSKYAPCYMETTNIKGESIGDIDWYASDIHDAIKCNSSIDFVDILGEAEANGTSMAMDFETQCRDGCYDQDQLFAVWESADVLALIERLKRCVR